MVRSSKVSTTLSNTENKGFTWDDAIREAETEIQLLRRQQKRLQTALRIFKANKRDGVSWPHCDSSG